MHQYPKQSKPLGKLTPDDFRKHPVWTLYEDDEDESLAIPVELTDFIDSKNYLAFFCHCTLTLHDGTVMEGNISLNLNNGMPYLIQFITGEEVFSFTGKLPHDFGSLSQLSQWLHKPIHQISPVQYSTSYQFQDNTLNSGEIDLSTG